MNWLEFQHAPAPHWIWSGDPAEPDRWVAFRRAFDLDARPMAAPAIVAADTKYWLWVNGVLVVREGGLKRGPTPDDGYADSIDLASWLRPGPNLLAALVWHLGHDGASHRDSGAGGLLFDLDVGGTRIVSDRRWGAMRHPAFDDQGMRRPGMPAQRQASDPHFRIDARGTSVTLSEWSTRFDSRREVLGWQDPVGHECAWPAATELGSPPQSPWGRLAERPIPFWRDSGIRPYTSLSVPALPCAGPIQVTGELPANLQVLPTFVVEARPGAELVISIERDYKTTTWVSAGGEQRGEVLAWGNGAQVVYDVPAGMRLLEVGWRETGYAADEAGVFTSSEPALDALWRKCARSVHLNMRDSFMDCPDRERAPWPGDTANSIEIAACTLDPAALRLARKTLEEFVAWASPEGHLWGAVPTGRFRGAFREFPAQSLAMIAMGLPAYVWHSGDVALVRDLWQPIRHYLLEINGLDETGLAIHRGPWQVAWGPGTQCWYDWGSGVDPVVLDQGWYALALRRFRDLAERIGEGGDAAEAEQRGSRLAQAIQERLWRPDRQAFIGRADEPDERGHALLALAGVLTSSQAVAVGSWMANRDQASIYMERHVLEALCELGRPAEALARIQRRYAEAIASPMSTLPEQFGSIGNHAWGGSPAIILAKHIAGVRPMSPGWSRCRIAPSVAAPERFALGLATVLGRVEIAAERSRHCWELRIRLPDCCTADVSLPASAGWSLPGAIQGIVRLDPGEHRLVGVRARPVVATRECIVNGRLSFQ